MYSVLDVYNIGLCSAIGLFRAIGLCCALGYSACRVIIVQDMWCDMYYSVRLSDPPLDAILLSLNKAVV